MGVWGHSPQKKAPGRVFDRCRRTTRVAELPCAMDGCGVRQYRAHASTAAAARPNLLSTHYVCVNVGAGIRAYTRAV